MTFEEAKRMREMAEQIETLKANMTELRTDVAVLSARLDQLKPARKRVARSGNTETA